MTLLTRSARQIIKQYGVEAVEDGTPAARRYSPNKVTIEVASCLAIPTRSKSPFATLSART